MWMWLFINYLNSLWKDSLYLEQGIGLYPDPHSDAARAAIFTTQTLRPSLMLTKSYTGVTAGNSQYN